MSRVGKLEAVFFFFPALPARARVFVLQKSSERGATLFSLSLSRPCLWPRFSTSCALSFSLFTAQLRRAIPPLCGPARRKSGKQYGRREKGKKNGKKRSASIGFRFRPPQLPARAFEGALRVARCLPTAWRRRAECLVGPSKNPTQRGPPRGRESAQSAGA